MEWFNMQWDWIAENQKWLNSMHPLDSVPFNRTKVAWSLHGLLPLWSFNGLLYILFIVYWPLGSIFRSNKIVCDGLFDDICVWHYESQLFLMSCLVSNDHHWNKCHSDCYHAMTWVNIDILMCCLALCAKNTKLSLESSILIYTLSFWKCMALLSHLD